MSSTISLPWDAPPAIRPAAVLRGNARGLEIVVDGAAELEAIITALNRRLAEAPAFFRGSDVRIRVDNAALPEPALAQIHDIARGYDLRVVAAIGPKPPVAESAPIPVASSLAGGSAPVLPLPDEPEIQIIVESEPASAPVALPPPLPPGSRLVVGPVRSGSVLDHAGHLVIFGDVNPGAEVRAEGNIIVLGRLRGMAHAGIGGKPSFILALRLEPQQLRLGRVVARAGDRDRAGSQPEIAHVIQGSIVVERYQGRLPTNLVAGM